MGMEWDPGGRRSNRFILSASFQVRLSPLLFLESTEASPQNTCSASLVETKDPPAEDTAEPPVAGGSRQCLLYPGPGGGYGFRLSYVANGPCLFISQVTDVPGPYLLVNLLLPSRPLEHPANFDGLFAVLCLTPTPR